MLQQTEILICGFSHHTAPFVTEAREGIPGYLFRLQTEGTAWATVNGERIRCDAGSLLLLEPQDRYRLEVEPFEHSVRGATILSTDYYLSVQGAWVEAWWARRTRKSGSLRLDLEDKLIILWRLLIAEKRKRAEGSNELAEYLVRALCLAIDSALETGTPARSKPFVASRMKAYIEEHATTPFKLADVSASVGLSASRCAHLFKEVYNTTINAYMQEVRLAVAEERIRYSPMTLEQVAASCGFSSYSYFHRVFRRKYGQSPQAFRQRYAVPHAAQPTNP